MRASENSVRVLSPQGRPVFVDSSDRYTLTDAHREVAKTLSGYHSAAYDEATFYQTALSIVHGINSVSPAVKREVLKELSKVLK